VEIRGADRGVSGAWRGLRRGWCRKVREWKGIKERERVGKVAGGEYVFILGKGLGW
jgi:hypothetical protein